MNRSLFAATLAACLALAPAASGGSTPPVSVGAAPGSKALSFRVFPSSGRLPLAVTFRIDAPKASHWTLDFGDGQSRSASGSPPAAVTHVYRTKGSFTARLSTTYPRVTTFFPAPSTPAPAAVTPVPAVFPLLTIAATPVAGTPHRISFALASQNTGDVSSWQVVFGDGSRTSGRGKPPASVAHSYPHAGTFTAYVILSESSASKFTRYRTPAGGLRVSVR